jgi:hypothetical protein
MALADMLVPFLGVIGASYLAATSGVTAVDVAILVAMCLFTAFARLGRGTSGSER